MILHVERASRAGMTEWTWLRLGRSRTGTLRCDRLVLTVACYGAMSAWMPRLRQVGVMARLHRGPTSLQLLCSPSHIHLLPSLSFSAGVTVTLGSDQDSLQHLSHPGSAPAVANDSVSPSPVTLQKDSVRPTESHPVLFPSHTLRLPLPRLIVSLAFLILLLPTHSFSVHILEDIYEHETERVHLHHFRCRGNLHFLLQPSPAAVLFLI